MRRHRERKRHPLPEPDDEVEAVRPLPLRLRAKYLGRSERSLYYMRAFLRNAEIKWDDDVVAGKHGRVAMRFLSEVCQLGGAEVQQAIHDMIKVKGAAAGRALWATILNIELRRLEEEERQQPVRMRIRMADGTEIVRVVTRANAEDEWAAMLDECQTRPVSRGG